MTFGVARAPFQERSRRRKQRRLKRCLMGGLFLVIALLVVWSRVHRGQRTDSDTTVNATNLATSPSPSAKVLAKITSSPSKTLKPATDIIDALQQEVDAHPELNLGISYINLKTGQHLDVNGNQAFAAASTTKLLAAILFLSQVQNGTYSLDQDLGATDANYQLQQMINQSNNDSWDLFNNLLTSQGEQNYAISLGLQSYQWNGNLFSANDMATLLSKLYKDELLNKHYTDLLLSYMRDTNEDSLVPDALPEGPTIYHKYGEFEDNVHDGALIDDGKHLYVLVIFTNGKGMWNYDDRTQTIHEIVQAVAKQL